MDFKTGDRVKIAELGPEDEWLTEEAFSSKLLGETGHIISIEEYMEGLITEGFCACSLSMDKPLCEIFGIPPDDFMPSDDNYIVFCEVKLEAV